jgi:oligogalacturonide lyase
VSRLSTRLTRRACILGIPLGLPVSVVIAADLVKGHTVPTEARRFADSATELEVVRLTNPAYTSLMTAPTLRSISHKLGFLIYSSDRGGSMQVWRLDLKTGESKLLTEAEKLDPASVALHPDERSFLYIDGDKLKHSYFAGLHDSTVYTFDAATGHTGGFALSDDGMYAAFGVETGSDSRLLLLNLIRRTTTELSQQHVEIAQPVFRPHRAQILYRKGGELWLVDFTGQNNRKLRTVEGGTLGPARWSPSGRTVYYLHFPGEHELNTLRELTPDENSDKLIAKTSQFVGFGMNADASVFVGASRNPSSPYVLLLLHVNHRELSLCEHHASDPMAVGPIFSPDSQRVFFESDRDGKPAIYRIRVEKFVEETDGG